MPGVSNVDEQSELFVSNSARLTVPEFAARTEENKEKLQALRSPVLNPRPPVRQLI